jgi:L-ascorbate metabolism protein UlaG (beta-lactamase superfamily)
MQIQRFSWAGIKIVVGPTTVIVCHREIRDKIAADGLSVHAIELAEPFSKDGVTVTAVPAVDGFGDPQVSWVIDGGGRKIIHRGDTL